MYITKKALQEKACFLGNLVMESINSADSVGLLLSETHVPNHVDSNYIQIIGLWGDDSDLILTAYENNVYDIDTKEIYIGNDNMLYSMLFNLMNVKTLQDTTTKV